MADVADLLARAKPRETTVAICLAGDLNGRHEDLLRQLSETDDKPTDDATISAVPPSRKIAEEIKDVERQMSEQVHVFRFRALPQTRFRELQRAHPPRDDAPTPERLFNTDTFPPVLIAACCTDPVFRGVVEVEQLFDKLGQGAYDRCVATAWEANTGGSEVPKSVLASAMMASTARR